MMHDTQEMLWTGTHYRTAPLARAEYETSATSVVISHWNNVYDSQPSAANIAVFADGELIESFHAPSAGAHQNEVELPAGEKLVEIVIGGMRGPGNGGSDLPTLVGQGIFLSGIEFNAPAQQTPLKKGGLLILTDSIGNGSTLAHPAVEAYPSLLRRMVDYPVRVLGRGGMALYDVTERVGGQNAFWVPKLEREVLRFQPDMVLFTLGYNDVNKDVPTSPYVQALRSFLSNMAEMSPSTRLLVTGMIPTLSALSNFDWFNRAIVTAFPVKDRRTDWRVGVVDTSQLNDMIHPNATAHTQMALFLKERLPTEDSPLVNLWDTEVPDGATTLSATRAGVMTSNVNGTARAYPAMWWDGPIADPNIPGDDYDIRYTLEDGVFSFYSGTSAGSWGRLQSNRGGLITGPFRLKVDIRDRETQTIQASSYFWKGLPPPGVMP